MLRQLAELIDGETRTGLGADVNSEAAPNLPELNVLAAEIVEDLEAALEQFRAIVEDLNDVS